jgi:hypothetical protein
LQCQVLKFLFFIYKLEIFGWILQLIYNGLHILNDGHKILDRGVRNGHFFLLILCSLFLFHSLLAEKELLNDWLYSFFAICKDLVCQKWVPTSDDEFGKRNLLVAAVVSATVLGHHREEFYQLVHTILVETREMNTQFNQHLSTYKATTFLFPHLS